MGEIIQSMKFDGSIINAIQYLANRLVLRHLTDVDNKVYLTCSLFHFQATQQLGVLVFIAIFWVAPANLLRFMVVSFNIDVAQGYHIATILYHMHRILNPIAYFIFSIRLSKHLDIHFRQCVWRHSHMKKISTLSCKIDTD